MLVPKARQLFSPAIERVKIDVLPARILIAINHYLTAHLISVLIEGCMENVVHEVHSYGPIAREKIEETCYDVVITEAMLPDLDHMELPLLVRERWPTSVTIAFSTWQDEDLQKESRENSDVLRYFPFRYFDAIQSNDRVGQIIAAIHEAVRTVRQKRRQKVERG
jgi:DNA-binding NarL/FixJ family response regulator